jgi:hypothetical protein
MLKIRKIIKCYEICFEENCPTHNMYYVRRKLRCFFGDRTASFNSKIRNKAIKKMQNLPLLPEY